MKQRILTAAVMLAVFIPVLIFSDLIVYPMVMAVLAAIATLELLRCLGLHRDWLLAVAVPLSAAMTLTARFATSPTHHLAVLAAAYFLLALYLFATAVFRPGRVSFGALMGVLGGGFYITVAFSAMVPEALRAADELAATSGYELEVVDLRTVKPLDTDTILASVARTARLMVVSEDFPWGGVAAEVIARVATQGLHLLDAPPLRVTAPDTPIPAHPDLWKAHRPGYENIMSAAHYLISL